MVLWPTNDFTGFIWLIGLHFSLRGAFVFRKFSEFFILGGRGFSFSRFFKIIF